MEKDILWVGGVLEDWEDGGYWVLDVGFVEGYGYVDGLIWVDEEGVSIGWWWIVLFVCCDGWVVWGVVELWCFLEILGGGGGVREEEVDYEEEN